MIIMSDKYPCFCEALEKFGYSVIPTDAIMKFLKPEQKHPDMQILKINDSYFLLNECKKLKELLRNYRLNISSKKTTNSYPENVQLNFLYFNNKLYGRADAISLELKKYCEDNDITIVNVNQGYARCSTLVLNNKAAITADTTIEKALKNDGAEVLKISEGNIILDGFDYGFIGGASAVINNNVIFFGNITNHPDYTRILEFIKIHNMQIKIICAEMPLTDIGGITVI